MNEKIQFNYLQIYKQNLKLSTCPTINSTLICSKEGSNQLKKSQCENVILFN